MRHAVMSPSLLPKTSCFTITAAGSFAAVSVAEHLHLIGDNLGGVAVLSVAILPFFGLKTTFNVDRFPLGQLLASDFREPSP